MSWMMTLLLISYTLAVYYAVRALVSSYESRAEMDVLKARELYHKHLLQQDEVRAEKQGLKEKFLELFTLYDMTKEITKSLSNEDAMEIFVDKLRENVVYKQCYFLDPLASNDIQAARDDPQSFTFPLHGKKEILGYIVIKGARQCDYDKMAILTNQFALVLRRIYLYKEVERLAITDSLTQVFTRRYIMERFTEELARVRLKKMRLSFLMLDVDYFKQVNDRYGHLVGDRVLQSVATKIMENVREIDIVGRYGGEEFCIVLPDTDAAGSLYVAQRVCKSIADSLIKAYDANVKVTVSIGISAFPDDGKSMSSLIDKADWALYQAKKHGRNQVRCFNVREN